jgi:hypothetical protein
VVLLRLVLKERDVPGNVGKVGLQRDAAAVAIAGAASHRPGFAGSVAGSVASGPAATLGVNTLVGPGRTARNPAFRCGGGGGNGHAENG